MCSANLSTDYFTNRQDRYWLINNKEVANYYALLIEYMRKLSFPLIADESIDTELPIRNLPELQAAKYKNMFSPEKDLEYGNQILNEFLTESKHLLSPFEQTKKCKKDFAFIVPSIQMGKYSIYDDLLFDMLNNVRDESEITLATAYFNIDDRLSNFILNSKNPWKLLTASPHSNGFLGSKGLSGLIPYMYLNREYELLKNLKEKGKENVSFYEWDKKGQTYHGKGLWISDSTNSSPTISVCGSSNYGWYNLIFYFLFFI